MRGVCLLTLTAPPQYVLPILLDEFLNTLGLATALLLATAKFAVLLAWTADFFAFVLDTH